MSANKTDPASRKGVENLKIKPCLARTYRKVHQILKHIVLSQKKAARKKKCIMMAGMKKREKTKQRVPD